jgi:hypothetical protein
MNLETFTQKLFSISNESDFERLALEVFNFQSTGNVIYREFINGLGIAPASINDIKKIP